MHPLLTYREWVHHLHFGEMHPTLMRVEHVLHEPRFWATLAAIAMLALLVGIISWGLGSGNLARYDAPYTMWTPYGY